MINDFNANLESLKNTLLKEISKNTEANAQLQEELDKALARIKVLEDVNTTQANQINSLKSENLNQDIRISDNKHTLDVLVGEHNFFKYETNNRIQIIDNEMRRLDNQLNLNEYLAKDVDLRLKKVEYEISILGDS